MNPRPPAAAPILLTLALAALAPAAAQTGGRQAAAVPARPPAATPARTPAEQSALTRGRALMTEFLAVKLDRLWAAFTPDVRGQWGTLEGFRAFRQTGAQQYGAEKSVVRERTFMQGDEAVYVRSSIYEKFPEQVWSFVVGFTGPQVTTFGVLLEEDRTDDPVGQFMGHGPL